MKNRKVIDSVSFSTSVSIDLVQAKGEDNLSLMSEWVKLCSYDPEIISRMDAHRFDEETEEWELKLHQEKYEPFNDNWSEKRKQIISKFEKGRKFPFPSLKEVQKVFEDLMILIEADESLNTVVDYPIQALLEDLKKLFFLIKKHKNKTLEICWRIM